MKQVVLLIAVFLMGMAVPTVASAQQYTGLQIGVSQYASVPGSDGKGAVITDPEIMVANLNGRMNHFWRAGIQMRLVPLDFSTMKPADPIVEKAGIVFGYTFLLGRRFTMFTLITGANVKFDGDLMDSVRFEARFESDVIDVRGGIDIGLPWDKRVDGSFTYKVLTWDRNGLSYFGPSVGVLSVWRDLPGAEGSGQERLTNATLGFKIWQQF